MHLKKKKKIENSPVEQKHECNTSRTYYIYYKSEWRMMYLSMKKQYSTFKSFHAFVISNFMELLL